MKIVSLMLSRKIIGVMHVMTHIGEILDVLKKKDVNILVQMIN